MRLIRSASFNSFDMARAFFVMSPFALLFSYVGKDSNECSKPGPKCELSERGQFTNVFEQDQQKATYIHHGNESLNKLDQMASRQTDTDPLNHTP
jgi:hypothetical protein